MASNQLSNLFASTDIAEHVAALNEQIASEAKLFAAHSKKLEGMLEKPMGEIVSPLTGKSFSETFVMQTSKNGFPQVVFFPWLKGKPEHAEHGGAAIRAMVSLLGTLKYKVTNWHEHVSWFDPRVRSISPVKAVTLDGKTWAALHWSNGTFKLFGMGREQDRRNFAAKHRELDLAINAFNNGSPFVITLGTDEWAAEWQRKVVDRVNLPLKAVLELLAKDADGYRTEIKFGQTRQRTNGIDPETGEVKPAVIGDIDLDNNKKVIEIRVISPLSGARTVLFDPSTPDYARQVENVRNAAAGYQYEVVKVSK